MNADEREDEPPDDEDESDLVPLGQVLQALDAERSPAAQETARDLLRTQRTPPHAIDAERALLGGCILDPTQIQGAVDAGLLAEHFWRPHHGTVWKALLSLIAKKEPVSTIWVADELTRMGKLDEVGGAAAISQLEAALPTAAHVVSYARLVAEKAAARAVISLALRAVEDAFAQVKKPDAIAAEMQKGARAIELRGVSGARSMRDIVRSAMDRLPMLGGASRKVKTGFTFLDLILGGGLTPGQLIIVAGRPSMGKTAAALTMASYQMGVECNPVAFMSLEMSAEELVTRIAGDVSQVDPNIQRASRHQEDKLRMAFGGVEDSPMAIVDTPRMSLRDIRREAKAAAGNMAEGKLGALYVDHLQLMGFEEGDDENMATKIGENALGLRNLAKELDCPVVCLAQINRDNTKATERRPQMSHLYASGAIEMHADVILFAHREEYYYPNGDAPSEIVGKGELIVSKNRNGKAGVNVPLLFDGDPRRWRNPD